MSRIASVRQQPELASLPTPPEWGELSADEIAQHAPDDTLVLANGDTLQARCSLWWTDAPPLAGEKLGVIGHFGAANLDASTQLLQHACRALAEQGCTIAVGPMDGNSWRRYRFIVERGNEPTFFLEPDNPDPWPSWWQTVGFAPLAHYYSALNDDLAQRDPRAAEVEPRLAENGVSIRPFDPSQFDDELHRIYAVAEVSFRDAFLYTPLPELHFAAQYHRVKSLVVPELALIAEHGERPVGFSFSIPDVREKMRGEPMRTVIVKTLAILPERRLLGGLGTLMADRTHEAARKLGFTRAVHALMHEGNVSRKISDRTGSVMRRYALFARKLV